jgi:hypothetical protein
MRDWNWKGLAMRATGLVIALWALFDFCRHHHMLGL